MRQRRCYWLLDGDDHVVLVHYLVAKPDGARALRVGSQGALDVAAASTGTAACEAGGLQSAQVAHNPVCFLAGQRNAPAWVMPTLVKAYVLHPCASSQA